MKIPRVVFCQLPSHVDGEYDYDQNRIFIDLRKPVNPALTFLHELLHAKYPKYSHSKIRQLTAKKWKRMSQKQRFELYKLLFNRSFKEFNYYLNE